MRCECGAQTGIVDSRWSGIMKWTRRVHECKECKKRFGTLEVRRDRIDQLLDYEQRFIAMANAISMAPSQSRQVR